jgi:hypothetical protein
VTKSLAEGEVALWQGRIVRFDNGVIGKLPENPARDVGIPEINSIAKKFVMELNVKMLSGAAMAEEILQLGGGIRRSPELTAVSLMARGERFEPRPF